MLHFGIAYSDVVKSSLLKVIIYTFSLYPQKLTATEDRYSNWYIKFKPNLVVFQNIYQSTLNLEILLIKAFLNAK